MIPSLNVYTSVTSASSGHLEPELVADGREGLGQDGAPLRVHPREPLAELGPVPGQRLQLEPDLLVGTILARGSAIAVRHFSRNGMSAAYICRCRSISRSVKRSSTRTSSCSTEPK